MQYAITIGIALALSASACMTAPPFCMRSWRIGHPTMDPEEMNIGLDGHVHAVSEGATHGAPAAGGK